MTFATLMVHIDQCDCAITRAQLACELASGFKASLLGVSGSQPKPPIAEPYTSIAKIAELMALECAAAANDIERAEARFRAIVGLRSGAKWRGALEAPVALIAAESRSADLIIVGRDASQASRRYAVDAGEVLMRAGRPVLVAPPVLKNVPIASRVVVAWKDSRESRRAAADALPFLKAANDVIVVEYCEDDDIAGARKRTEDVAAFLAHHTVKANPVAFSAANGSIAERLIAFSLREEAGLIVSGGYGHSCVHEWAFGGVTREMLNTSPICCLFSH